MCQDEQLAGEVRAQALLALGYAAKSHCEVLATMNTASSPALAYLLEKTCSETETPASVDDDAWADAVNIDGNPQIGQLVFETTTSQCLTCHQVDGWGGKFGPDLSNIGQSKSPYQLIQAILNPSLEIAPEWQGWYVKDQAGELHYGRQIDVHLNHVELMNANGDFDRFDSPQSFGTSAQSLMPEGLHQTMTPEEFNHLIAYLTSL
ncbi:MAG: hypothetical protein AAF399_06745 [Bacteroidota bacterium]